MENIQESSLHGQAKDDKVWEIPRREEPELFVIYIFILLIWDFLTRVIMINS